MEDWNKKPAIVKYIGQTNRKFTFQHEYEAYFLEYWQGKRDSLHVRDNYGLITDFNSFSYFEVISDVCNLLNNDEAIVWCKTHKCENESLTLCYGKEYKAIGRDKDGLFLVMDDSHDCYFYPAHYFEVVEDPAGILEHRSIYYSYHRNGNIK